MEERWSEEVFAGVAGLDWLRLRKLLLPMRRNRPRGCCDAAGSVATVKVEELVSLGCVERPWTLLLPVELAPLPRRKLRMLLLLPKNLRRLKPVLGPPAEAERESLRVDEAKDGGRLAGSMELVLLCWECWLEIGKGSEEREAEPCSFSKAGDCAEEADGEDAVAASEFVDVAERSRFLSLGGSDRLEEDGAPEEGAAALCLNIMAVPSELTRRRMPLRGAKSAGAEADFEEEEIEDGGAELDAESGMGMARTGKGKLGAEPEVEGREVSVILNSCTPGWCEGRVQ